MTSSKWVNKLITICPPNGKLLGDKLSIKARMWMNLKMMQKWNSEYRGQALAQLVECLPVYTWLYVWALALSKAGVEVPPIAQHSEDGGKREVIFCYAASSRLAWFMYDCVSKNKHDVCIYIKCKLSCSKVPLISLVCWFRHGWYEEG